MDVLSLAKEKIIKESYHLRSSPSDPVIKTVGEPIKVRNMKETILCAAIYYDDDLKHEYQPVNILTGLVFCGHRHAGIIQQIYAAYYPDFKTDPSQNELRIEILNSCDQGFLTSKNRFVEREEAATIFNTYSEKKSQFKELYSEDLY